MSDLRDWIAVMERHGRLVRIDREVDPYAYEATAVVRQLELRNARHAVLFEQPLPLEGRAIGAKLLFNVYGHPEHVAIALGMPGATWPVLLDTFAERMKADVPAEPVDRAPAQEHVIRGDEVDLRMLPFARHIEMEGGAYFTPTIVAKKPEGPRHNLSWNRCMYLDPRHVALHVSPRGLWSYILEAEEVNEPLPIAIVLGHQPLFNQAAASLVAVERDEYEAAGGIMGEPVRLAPSISFGEELMVPADAEILLEGEILPRQRTLEGPFGEYMRYLGPQKLSNVARISAITYRSGPIITEIFTSHDDHLNACVAIEASLLRAARAVVPSVVSTSWFHGDGPTTLVISLQKVADGLPMRAALGAMAASNMIKQVIVVDEDIDPRDPHEVLWAISTRTNADEDITILKGLQGTLLDPSLSDTLSTSGFVIDATCPRDRPYPARARVPQEALERFRLEDYVDIARFPKA